MEDPNRTHLWRYLDDSREILVCVNVNYLLLAVSDDLILQIFKEFLLSKYPICDLGPVEEFLHINIDQNLTYSTRTMHQVPHLESILAKFSMNCCIHASQTPLPLKVAQCFSTS